MFHHPILFVFQQASSSGEALKLEEDNKVLWHNWLIADISAAALGRIAEGRFSGLSAGVTLHVPQSIAAYQ